MRVVGRIAAWLAGVVAVAALIVGLSFETTPASLPTAAAGESIEADPVKISVHSVELRSAFAGTSASPDEGFTFLAVTATVENTWNQPIRSFDGILSPGGITERPNRVIYDEPGMVWATLQPGVATTVVFSWQVPIGEFVPGEPLSVIVNTQTLTTGGLLDSSARWIQPAPLAEVVLDLGVGSVRSLG